MGAWGAGHFENDTAADWIAEIAEDGSADDVREALSRVVEADEYVEAPDGCEALAAAEVVAAARGRAPAEADEDAVAAAARMPELAADAPLALAALAAVLDPERSELHQLWDEAEPEEWLAAVADLRARLT
jgi:hypothetical protein